MLLTFGKNPSGEALKKLQQSPNFKEGKFQNLMPVEMFTGDASVPKVLWQFINKPKSSKPLKPLPAVKTNLKDVTASKPFIVWFGHSSYFIRINNTNILVDPVFSGYAAPFSFMNKSFAGTNIYTVDDMPDIDILLITHDHYDHLDYETVTKLRSKVKRVFTSPGVGSHLIYWGFDKKIITELDWWQSANIVNIIQFTAAPAQHFSGRGITRFTTLWSSFILQTNEYKIYIGGDSGYTDSFKKIGERFGAFDIAILENGQYNNAWRDIHMLPEETVQACIDLKAKILLPVHWAKFDIALHSWDEPIKRLTKKAKELNVPLTTPVIGEPVIIDESYPQSRWWEL